MMIRSIFKFFTLIPESSLQCIAQSLSHVVIDEILTDGGKSKTSFQRARIVVLSSAIVFLSLTIVIGCSDDATNVLPANSERGFPKPAPWLSFYGSAENMGDIGKVAATFRIVNIDADPDIGNFSNEEITQLRNGGVNRVISYFNLGSCEHFRSYWTSVPSGFVAGEDNVAAQLGPYGGYPDETWMNLGNADYQRLLIEYIAPRLVAAGIDGFFFDNLEIVEHDSLDADGPGSAACTQGGLDVVRRLREKYPKLLFVMQNATSNVTRNGTTGGIAFTSLLDGISHEEVYKPLYDNLAESELIAWSTMQLKPGGRSLWIATEDYVGSCANTTDAQEAYARSRALGFSPYATDSSSGQQNVCYWPF